jgi:short-subunit dehydrogenase
MSDPLLLIVGAGPRLGEAVARRFGRDGYDVALVARNESRLAELGRRLKADGITAGWSSVDISDAAALTEAVTRFVDYTGRVDVLLHNVSVTREVRVLDVPPDVMLADLAVGAVSLLAAAQAVAPAMIRAGHGTILATGSGAADHAIPEAATLAPQKAALRAILRGLAAELKPEGVHCATVIVRGLIAGAAPAAIADVYADLVAETARPASEWRAGVDFSP